MSVKKFIKVFAAALLGQTFLLSQSLFAQATYVTENGIILERLSEEEQEEAERLNRESEAEDMEAAKKNVSQPAQSKDGGAGEDDASIDDIDALFADDSLGDTETAVTTKSTETIRVDPKNKPVDFSGSLKAELGGYLWFYPWEKTRPLASFSNTLKWVGRPATDFYVTGSLLAAFTPSEQEKYMDIGLYELYFDYTLFGLVDITAGKRDVSWSLSRMLSTDILEDEYNTEVVAEDVLNRPDRNTSDSKFYATFNIPIFSYGSVQGIGRYIPYNDDMSSNNMAMAGKIEGSFGKFSTALYGMRDATNNPNRMNPTLGLEIVSTILGKNSNMFVQGQIHVAAEAEKKFNRARVTSGVYKYFQNPVMLGLAFEYQGIWDERGWNFDPLSTAQMDENDMKKWQHYFAAQMAWSHFIFGKKWTFGVEWFHDYRRDYGTMLPVIKVESVLRYTDLRIAIPVYYGSKERYGLIFEAIINLDY